MGLLQQIPGIPVQELWKESYIAIGELESQVGSVMAADPYRDSANFIIILALVTFLVFAHRRIMAGLVNAFTGIFSSKRLVSIEKQYNLQVCRNTLFMFLTMFASFVFANIAYATKIIGHSYTVPVKFAGIFGFILLFFTARNIISRFLAWVNNKSVFKLAGAIGYTFCCIWYILVLCCFFVIKAIPSAPMGTMRYCIIYSILAIFIPYFIALYKIFIHKGVSHISYILYLCTLEILPVAVLLYLNFN